MIHQTLKAHTKNLGDGFEVRCLLPAATRKMVGPFIFFDHMGPTRLSPGQAIDVRPHPHIGLATVTYLFEGAIMHRDSLGYEQRITPGDVNWMTAGRGIVHSERSPADERNQSRGLHGIQTWIALPQKDERTDPAFSHHPRASLPVVQWANAELRLIAGECWGQRSPVRIFSPMFYGAITAQGQARFELPTEYAERAIYVVNGEVQAAGTAVMPHTVAVFDAGAQVTIETVTAARIMVFGGAPVDGDRHISWNFVASSQELIEEARTRWRNQEFPGVPGETEFIPLP
ncbi:MAG: pirin family protein [Betaproteobacteria bacterium]|jgi:redox-sensitive bicupin YhaK (pirin superfamily)|nr:pirin family protein [Betaproteobacteria bacterium]MDH5341324.1 pirin family protein [Betaproteobacteria bacterium]